MMPAKNNPDATVAMKALVLYGLLLFSGRRYSLRELAGRLDCSKQTVLRLVEQIETTRALPVHVQSELTDGQRYYWAAKPNGAPNVTLAEEDIQQLVLCRDIVWHVLPESLRNEISQTIQHATVLLPDFDRRAVGNCSKSTPKSGVLWRFFLDIESDHLSRAVNGYVLGRNTLFYVL